ncbi:MAG: hypothetical protein ACRC5R_01720, partial [Mycoplasmatales bacterium]
MKEDKTYKIVSYGNLSNEDIEKLNCIGFLEGELVNNMVGISCSKSMCLFKIENSSFAINHSYILEIEVEEYNG